MNRYPRNRAKRFEEPVSAFLSKIDPGHPGGCWVWTACKDEDGYGYITVLGRLRRAHRWAYELVHGPVPDGLQLDHLCRNRACVNPAHLEPVTNRENQIRGAGFVAEAIRKTHCPRGHALSGDNLQRYLLAKGWRSCATCARQRTAARKLARAS